MLIRFNVTGTQRKVLVAAVSEITGCDAVYQKAPTFAYVVHNYTIDKDGSLLWDERTDMEETHRLLSELAERSFVSEDVILAQDSPDLMDEVIPDQLTIEVPLEGFSELALSNLEKLVASKAALIRKSLSAAELPIHQEEHRLCFPWFKPNASADEVRAYTLLVEAMCDVAKTQTRIVATEKAVPNEKYAMRCFLLRLGFIGDEFAAARKLLLSSLSGDASFRDGKRGRDAGTEGAHAAHSGSLGASPTPCLSDESSVTQGEESS